MRERSWDLRQCKLALFDFVGTYTFGQKFNFSWLIHRFPTYAFQQNSFSLEKNACREHEARATLGTMQQKILKSGQNYAFESNYRDEGVPATMGERPHRPLPAMKTSTHAMVQTLKSPPGRNFPPIAKLFFTCCSARRVLLPVWRILSVVLPLQIISQKQIKQSMEYPNYLFIIISYRDTFIWATGHLSDRSFEWQVIWVKKNDNLLCTIYFLT